MPVDQPISRPVVFVVDVRKSQLPLRTSPEGVFLNGQLLGGDSGAKLPWYARTTELLLSSGQARLYADDPIPVLRVLDGSPSWFISWICDTQTGACRIRTASDFSVNALDSPYRGGEFCHFEPNGVRLSSCLYSRTWPQPRDVEPDGCGGYVDRTTRGVVDPRYSENDIRANILRFRDVQTLSAGDVLSWEHAFTHQAWWRCGEDVMTDGFFAVPLERPRGEKAWNLWYHCGNFESIKGAAWHNFTRALRGMYRADVFTRIAALTEKPVRLPLVIQRMRDLQRGDTPRPPAGTGCFNGYGTAPHTSIDGTHTRFMWQFGTEHGPVYVVDSPDVQACYVFMDQAAAERWFKFDPAFNYKKAREASVAFIVHRPGSGWERSLDELLANLGVLQAAAAIYRTPHAGC